MMHEPLGEPVYLTYFLGPLQPFLDRADVTDIYVNRPQELWTETLGGKIERHDVPSLKADMLDRLAEQVAALTHQGINREHPLLSATLRPGVRVQFVAPPVTRGTLLLAIRKHQATSRSIDDYALSGLFDLVASGGDGEGDARARALCNLHEERDFANLMKLAVKQRRNILVSGGTSTGKTTFLSSLLREIPNDERLILIEDTPELELRHENAVGLIAARSALGEAIISTEDLLNASLRMRPDRIIIGELRGREAFTFLRAVNTGHPGSMTTIHADSPSLALEQLALLVLESGTTLDRASVLQYVESTIDVSVQLARTGGRRHVVDIVLSSRLRAKGQC